jgi:hypothetical protein
LNKEELQTRLNDLLKQNDEINLQLVDLEKTKEQLITNALVNNGRILEIRELIKKE